MIYIIWLISSNFHTVLHWLLWFDIFCNFSVILSHKCHSFKSSFGNVFQISFFCFVYPTVIKISSAILIYKVIKRKRGVFMLVFPFKISNLIHFNLFYNFLKYLDEKYFATKEIWQKFISRNLSNKFIYYL